MLTSSRPGDILRTCMTSGWIFSTGLAGDHTLAQKYYFVSDLHMGGDGQLQH